MADQIIASVALLLFLVFLVFLALYIGELDLWIVILAVGMLAATDFASSIRGGGNPDRKSGPG